MVQAYRNVEVWRRAYRLAMDVLDLTESPPLAKQFWLRDQLVRSVFSIQANVAEGNGRSTAFDYAAFLDRARASTFETDTWLLVAGDRAWISHDVQRRLEGELDAISAMLYSMARTLRSKGKPNLGKPSCGSPFPVPRSPFPVPCYATTRRMRIRGFLPY